MSIARDPATAQPSPSGATGRGRVLCRSYGAWIGHRGRAVYRHGAPTELWAGSWAVCRSVRNKGLPMNLGSEMVDTLALTPALSPGERVDHLPLLENLETPDFRSPRRDMVGSGFRYANLFGGVP
jgi:hypothetical protein